MSYDHNFWLKQIEKLKIGTGTNFRMGMPVTLLNFGIFKFDAPSQGYQVPKKSSPAYNFWNKWHEKLKIGAWNNFRMDISVGPLKFRNFQIFTQ